MRFTEKISITVKIPALDSTYDFIVPNNMSVRNAQGLMIRILNSEYRISNKSADTMLFDASDNMALCLEYSFAQLGISDGAKSLLTQQRKEIRHHKIQNELLQSYFTNEFHIR